MTDDIPERVLEKPKSANEDFLPEIAEKLGITVSMLRSQPDDVQQMIRIIYLQTQHDDGEFTAKMQQVMRSSVQYVSTPDELETANERDADHINGISNNLPPETVASKQGRQTEVFTFSRSRLRELAAAAKQTAAQNARAANQNLQNKEAGAEITRKEGGT